MGVILDRMGFEIEGLFGTRDEIHSLMRTIFGDSNFIEGIHRDASTETPCYSVNGFGVINLPDRLLKDAERRTLGYEIVSKPLSISEMEIFIPKVLIGLQRFGERFSPRTSIHIHVGFPESFYMLKKGLKLGSIMDALLFRLAGLGNPFRGSINSSIYCRPLSFAPFVIGEDSGSKFQLNPLAGLGAKNMKEIWNGYFINYERGENERFHPARYFAWNLYSVLIRGTLEFRYFNLCLNPEWIMTIAHLCQSLAEMAVIMEIPDVKILNPFKSYEDNIYEEMIENILSTIQESDMLYKEICSRKEILLKILHSTPQHNLGNQQVLTHIQRAYPESLLKQSGLSSTRDFIPDSGFIDIHSDHVYDTLDLLI